MIRRKRSLSLNGIASLIMTLNNIIAVSLEIASVYLPIVNPKQKCLIFA